MYTYICILYVFHFYYNMYTDDIVPESPKLLLSLSLSPFHISYDLYLKGLIVLYNDF